jgi:amino acid transporter
MSTQLAALRPHCLSFWTVLAQSIALISPTMTAVLIVPLMFGTSGQASWLAYAFGTIMLLFVALNLNQFARRSSHTGSMFLYSVAGLGPTAGGLTGWCLIWAYMFIGTAGVTGFTIFAQQLLTMVHVSAPPMVLFAVCAAVCWYCAYKDVRLSAVLMLVLEAVSVALITALAFVVLGHHGFTIDTDQLTLKGNSLSTMGLGVVVAIFSLVGFEAATCFGEEAKNPLKTIPRVHRSPRPTRCQPVARQTHRSDLDTRDDDASRRAADPDRSWRDAELLFASALVHERRLTRGLSNGTSGVLP